MVIAAIVGLLAGNELKTILQDARGLAYFVLFLYVLWEVRDARRHPVLAARPGRLHVRGFALGVIYSLLGQGMAVDVRRVRRVALPGAE